MRRALAALLSCAALLAVGADSPANDEVAATAEPADSPTNAAADDDDEPGVDDEGDSAPFTLVVEHADGWRCGASLVSLRTAVTSARCARGDSPATPAAPAAPAAPAPHPAHTDLWVHATSASRRVARVAFAADSEVADGEGLSDADVAVLELEAPLGGGARAILMATSGAECGPPAACHVVRARRGRGARPVLRIVDEALVAGDVCAALEPRRSPARRLALCLRGDRLCPSDWGAGVVCVGKLCGVLSVSAQEPGARRDLSCGAVHEAQPVARWRRFLHCAHTPHACRRGGECAHLCSERLLLDDAAPAEPAPPRHPPADPLHYDDTTLDEQPTPPYRTSLVAEIIGQASPYTRRAVETVRVGWSASAAPTRTAAPALSSAPTLTSAPAPVATAAPTPGLAPPPPSARLVAEFEPNRPDFKAGEYGDNAAEYGGDEPAPAPAAPTRSSPPPTEGAGGAGAGGSERGAARHEVAARVSPGALRSARPALRAASPLYSGVLTLLYAYIVL